MPKEIRMPKLSDTMEEGTLLQWRKREGEAVQRGEILADIETDKADMEFESFTDGTVAKLLVRAGETVEVGVLIAVIRLPGESDAEVAGALEASAVAAPSQRDGAAAQAERAAPAGESMPASPPAAAPLARAVPAALPPAVGGERISVPLVEDDRLRVTPRARRIAEERGVDLSELEGSGPGGAVLVSDVESYLQELEAQAPDAEGIRATPVALRIAGDLGLNLEAVKGSGPGGRITKADVLGYAESAKQTERRREAELFRGTVQLSQKRKALIRNMVRSKEEAPHFYLQMDAQCDALRELRDRLNASAGDERPRVTYTHLILKAAALALEKLPEANATFRPEENVIALYDRINIALAVEVQDELVAPTIKDCQGKSVFQLAEEANRLVQRARMRRLQPEDYADGTFTISNLGMFGVDRFYGIVTPPQSSILSVSSVGPRPVARDGELAVASVTTLGLSVDHRVLDGVRAAQLLGEVRRLLEQPEELMSGGPGLGE
jgi:pyruvate dehydrogenase E2 component (dihydrolipoamide acetyltransferase)